MWPTKTGQAKSAVGNGSAVDGERSCAVSRHHGNLAVGLIEGIRLAVGATRPDRLIQAWQETMVVSYCNVLEPLADLSDRAREPRRATWRGSKDSAMAAFCSSRIIVQSVPRPRPSRGSAALSWKFSKAAFGDDASVTREEHLLSGDGVAFIASLEWRHSHEYRAQRHAADSGDRPTVPSLTRGVAPLGRFSPGSLIKTW